MIVVERKVLKGGAVALVVLVAAAVLIGIFTLATGGSDDRGDKQRVVDRASGLAWEMYGTPRLATTTSKVTTGPDAGRTVNIRTYTVDHQDWVERVRVFDASPGSVDFSAAAVGTFAGPAEGRLSDVQFTKVAIYPAAAGGTTGTVKRDSKVVPVKVEAFASQISNYMISGGIAVPKGEDPSEIDQRDQAKELRRSVSTD